MHIASIIRCWEMLIRNKLPERFPMLITVRRLEVKNFVLSG